MKKICVLGGGSWGTALAKVLCENGHDVVIWLRNEEQCKSLNNTRINERYLPNVVLPDSLKFTVDYEEALSGCDLVLNSVPTQNIRKVLKSIPKVLLDGKIIVNSAKGIELGTHSLISNIINEECPSCKYAVLSGPSHAEEVAKKMPTAITVACSCDDTAKIVQDLFMTEYLRVYTNRDVVGVEFGGAVKNVIALGAGICDGVGFGDNAKAALITRGIIEISRLGVCMGAETATFQGLSGIGDLIVTCTSKHSRNRNAGFLIGQGNSKQEAVEKIGMVVEGMSTTYAVYELSKQFGVDMPIVNAMYEVLENAADVKKIVTELMIREKKDEANRN